MATRPGAVPLTAAGVAAVVVAAFALLTGGQKAATLGLTRHGELAVAVDAGGAGVVGLTGITPGTPTQVLTVSDSGVPVWRAIPAGVTLAGTGAVAVYAGDAGTVDGAGAADASVMALVNGVPRWIAASTGVDPWAAIALPITGDWTLTNGGLAGASAAESSGTLLLTFPAAGTQSALAGVDYARAYQALEPGNAYAYSLIARLAQITNNSGLYGRFFVAKDTAIASNQYGMQVRGSDGAAQFYAWTTGGSTPVGSGFTLPTDGTGWVRLKMTPPGVSYYYGTGTTTDPPASWTYQGATPITDQREFPVRAGYLAGWPNGALGATGTVTWANSSLTVP